MNKILKMVAGFAIAFVAWGLLFLIMNWQVDGGMKSAKLLMLLILPIGSSLFLANDEYDWELGYKIIRAVGLIILVASAFIFHLKVMGGDMKVTSGCLVIFPIVCASASITYIAFGYETLGFVGKASLFIVAGVLSFVNWFIFVLIGAGVVGLAVFYLILGVIALGVLAGFRIKMGTAFY